MTPGVFRFRMSGLSLFLGIPCSLIVNSPTRLLQALRGPDSYSRAVRCESNRKLLPLPQAKRRVSKSAPFTQPHSPAQIPQHGMPLKRDQLCPSSKMLSLGEKGFPRASCVDVAAVVQRERGWVRWGWDGDEDAKGMRWG